MRNKPGILARLLFGLFFVLATPVGVVAAPLVSLLPNGKQTFVDANGAPLAGGSVYFYIPSTSTLKDTWQDPNKSALNTNPVILDSAGRAIIYGSGQYREVVKDAIGNTIWDQLTNDTITPTSFFNGGSAAGTANALTIAATDPGSWVLTVGNTVTWKATATNTGATTLNVASSGIKNLYKKTTSGLTALAGGEIQSGSVYSAVWDGTQYELLSPSLGPTTTASLNEDIIVSPSGSLTANEAPLAKTGNYTLTETDRNKVAIWTLAATATATLPSAVSIGAGYRVKLMNSATSTVGLAVVSTAGAFYGPNYNGGTTYYLNPGESIIVTSTGTNWVLSAQGKNSNSVSLSYSSLAITTADGGVGSTITARELVLESTLGDTVKVKNVNVVASIDTGSIAAATWYYDWVFYNPTTRIVSARYSLSSTSPTYPSGAVYSARVGAVRTKSASAVFEGTLQKGNVTQYAATTNTRMQSGSASTWTAVAIGAYTPPTASAISIILKGANASATGVAPNTTYAITSTTNAAPIEIQAGTNSASAFGSFLIESSNVYYGSNTAAGALFCMGWTDNL